MRIELVACACCLTNVACFTTTYVTKHPVGAEREVWHHNFVAGFVETGAPADLREFCPDGVARVKTEISFINGLASAVVNGATSYLLDMALSASISDLDRKVRTGIDTGYNVASNLIDPIWTPSTLTITCIGSGGRSDPPAPGTDPPPGATPAEAGDPDEDFNAFLAPGTFTAVNEP